MMKETRGLIQWVAGILAAGVLVWMFYRSQETAYSMDWVVTVGMLSLVVLLIYGPATLEALVDAWRRTNGK